MKKAEDKAFLLLQVHDELVYEIKEEMRDELGKKIKNIMEGVLDNYDTNGVPIIAEAKAGPTWGDTNPLVFL